MIDYAETKLALRSWLLATSPLPADRVWENNFVVVGSQKVAYQPKQGVPYLTEAFRPEISSLQSLGQHGMMESRGSYVVTWFGITGDGDADIHAGINALQLAFLPGRQVTMTSGNRLRIQTDPAPSPGQIIPIDGGHSYCQMIVPWAVEWYRS